VLGRCIACDGDTIPIYTVQFPTYYSIGPSTPSLCDSGDSIYIRNSRLVVFFSLLDDVGGARVVLVSWSFFQTTLYQYLPSSPCLVRIACHERRIVCILSLSYHISFDCERRGPCAQSSQASRWRGEDSSLTAEVVIRGDRGNSSMPETVCKLDWSRIEVVSWHAAFHGWRSL
jgi:hypothetical protein